MKRPALTLLVIFLLVGVIVAVVVTQSSSSTAAAASQADPSFLSSYRDKTCFAGPPVPDRSSSSFTILRNTGYDVGYSDDREDPLWVAYTLRADVTPIEQPRPPHQTFAPDPRVRSGVTTSDYTNSGYSRGHLAPSDAIGRYFGHDAMIGTFIVTNICPQRQDLNGGAWEGLEAAETHRYIRQFKQIWVLDGPVFPADAASAPIIGHGVRVPAAFFKIIVEDDSGDVSKPAVLAVVMPQETRGTHHALGEFVTTVRDIESRTGLEFFTDLPDAARAAIETTAPDPGLWHTDWIMNGSAIRGK